MPKGSEGFRKTVSKYIGAQITHHRLRRGLTREELAEAIGLGASSIKELENATRGTVPGLVTLVSIADVLNVDLPALLGDLAQKRWRGQKQRRALRVS